VTETGGRNDEQYYGHKCTTPGKHPLTRAQ
jgi:hypothetical protein